MARKWTLDHGRRHRPRKPSALPKPIRALLLTLILGGTIASIAVSYFFAGATFDGWNISYIVAITIVVAAVAAARRIERAARQVNRIITEEAPR